MYADHSRANRKWPEGFFHPVTYKRNFQKEIGNEMRKIAAQTAAESD